VTADQSISEHEHWGSRIGFLLTAIGSAAGLGNIWRFSYVAGENGGAAFLIIYLLCAAIVGVPLLIAELSIGRSTQSDAVQSFTRIAPGKPWFLAGILGAAGVFFILSYYSVIAGWALKYFVSSLGGIGAGTGSGYGEKFSSFIAEPFEPLIWQFIMLLFTVIIVARGVNKGIESLNKILLPMLGVVILGLATYGLLLKGGGRGLEFMFTPDWGAFLRPEVYLAALGQAFFSIGVGMAIFITYGSYMTAEQNIPKAAFTVVGFDTLLAIVAGIAIFPAVFAFGLDPAAGPELAFITLPNLFAIMLGGEIVEPLFFGLLIAGAITSMVSMLEVPTAYLMRRLSTSRGRVASGLGIAAAFFGVPSSLGFGEWSDITWQGRSILASLDYLFSNITLPIGGITIALFAGWAWKRSDALAAAGISDGVKGQLWLLLLRFGTPALIALILFQSLNIF